MVAVPTSKERVDQFIDALRPLLEKSESFVYSIRRPIVDDGEEQDEHGRPFHKLRAGSTTLIDITCESGEL